MQSSESLAMVVVLVMVTMMEVVGWKGRGRDEFVVVRGVQN